MNKNVDPNKQYTPEEAEALNIKIDMFGYPILDKARDMRDFFLIPPFSIINTMEGEWQQRKKRWDNLIQTNTQSREGTLFAKGGETSVAKQLGDFNYGVSIFDSCLAEILCKWFAHTGFNILDPFAGGNFGYVSSYLDMNFTGFEIRAEQCDVNNARLIRDGFTQSKYINASSEDMDNYVSDNTMDMLFSCPPYLDLEVYSDNPKDLSTMKPEKFFEVYGGILKNGAKKLKDNRFAVLVVSEVRCKKTGGYLGLTHKSIDIMREAGLMFYNEIILMNSVGTLPLRVNRQMNSGCKVGRRHQNILVFYKGDPKKIKDDFPELIPNNNYYNNI